MADPRETILLTIEGPTVTNDEKKHVSDWQELRYTYILGRI
jgi:hypothetical protein